MSDLKTIRARDAEEWHYVRQVVVVRKVHPDPPPDPLSVAIADRHHLLQILGRSPLDNANLADCVEYVMEDGRRFAWSDSNVCYEEVPQDGSSFTLLRQRLADVQDARIDAEAALYHLANRRHHSSPTCESCQSVKRVLAGYLDRG